MDLSERHARRLLAAYRELGAGALAHGNRGRRPHNAVPEAVGLLSCASRHALRAPRLLEEPPRPQPPHGARILTRAGMPSPRRRPPQHRVGRAQPRAGMLLQVDGSHHAWLEQRGPRFALRSPSTTPRAPSCTRCSAPPRTPAATSCSEGVLRRSGVPLALYNDRHAVFRASASSAREARRPPRWHESRSPPQRGYFPPRRRPHVGGPRTALTSLSEVGDRPWHRVQQSQRAGGWGTRRS